MEVFWIDGIAYDVIVPENGIKREFNVTDTSNAGRSSSGEMIRDIIGTYYNYSLTVLQNPRNKKAYFDFYNAISQPKESHKIDVPYNGQYISFDAYVTKGSDVLYTLKNGTSESVWKGLSINFIAMSPQWRSGGSLSGIWG